LLIAGRPGADATAAMVADLRSARSPVVFTLLGGGLFLSANAGAPARQHSGWLALRSESRGDGC
jgi:hypothetical protein